MDSPTPEVESEEKPRNILQELADSRINPWAVQLMCEDLLKLPNPVSLEFFFPINRGDCAGWSGVQVKLEPIPSVPETAG